MPTPRVLLLTVLVLAAAFARLLPHLHNFAPVAAVALFAAAYLPSRRWSVLLPLVAMFLSDIVLYATKDTAYRDHAVSNMLFVYSAYAIVALIGQWLRARVTTGRVVTAALAGSITFFLVTNFGAWLMLSQPLSATEPAIYERTLSGLLDCFIAGVPFFRGTFFGDMAYTVLLFGGFALLERTVPQLRSSPLVPTTAR
ncbi:MAG: hypothetical protein FD138_4064 [Planctomycetota bacterium]|nr:MAG: hypothetical protein FD138_4064 [Planctomycetota bacterium]